MEPGYVVLIAVGSAFVVAVPIIVLIARRLPLKESDERTRQLEAELAASSSARAESDRRAAVADEKTKAIPALQASIGEARDLAEKLRQEKAAEEREHGITKEVLSAKLESVEHSVRTEADLRRRLADAQTALAGALDSIASLQTQLATLKETLSQEKKQSDEKLADQKRMSDAFKVLAEEIMQRHGETFKVQNKEQIDLMLTPLRDQIVAFQQGLQLTHTETAKDRAALAEQIRSLTETSSKMSTETRSLTLALKGDSQTQGAWGEMVLATILERSGLREGEEYFKQESHSGEDGVRLRPDVFVNFPGDKRIVVDSKVSLTAFESYLAATDDEQRALHLARHSSSLRNHVRDLSSKEYQQLTPSGLDFVIMFVPIEGALAVALQGDPGLSTFAIERNVVIAAPTTLMIALRTIANVWRMERRNKNAEAIAERAGRMYNKFVGFVDDMQVLGLQLEKVRGSFDSAMGKLSTGGGNLVGQVEKLKDLGAKTAKTMPKELLDLAGVDEQATEDAQLPAEATATPDETPPEPTS